MPCKTLLKWKAKDGTSGLKAHLKACTSQKQTTVIRITELFASKSASPSHDGRLTAGDRTKITDDIVRFCAKDIRPFSVVEGAGFLELASELISLGAKYGNIPVKDVLLSARTLSRHVQEVVTREKQVMQEMLRKIDRFGVTTDLWTQEKPQLRT